MTEKKMNKVVLMKKVYFSQVKKNEKYVSLRQFAWFFFKISSITFKLNQFGYHILRIITRNMDESNLSYGDKFCYTKKIKISEQQVPRDSILRFFSKEH